MEVEAIIAEAERKKHHALADRYRSALEGGGRVRYAQSVPNMDGLLMRLEPRRTLDELILDEYTRAEVDTFIDEQRQSKSMYEQNIPPRNRMMLVGPPGNGKTTLAEAIAESLDIPMFVARYENLVSSYLGETAKKVNRAFEFVTNRPCLFFLDEFDAIASERTKGAAAEYELGRVVSSLLLWLERMPATTVVVAATNHSKLLDFAMWRRLQIILYLGPPTPESARAFLVSLASDWAKP